MTISYWPIGHSTSLGAIQPSAAASAAPTKTHYIIITDKSGSMSWAERQMQDDMVAHLNEIPDGSYLSLGWFSSSNQWDWDLLGFLVMPETRSDAVKIIRRGSGSWNMTCYTDVLSDLKNAITKLGDVVDATSVSFMSDGHPNQGGGRDQIIKIVKDHAPLVSAFSVIGYGDYYNRQLLADMAAAAGGTLVHAGDFKDFSKAVTGTIKMRQTAKRVMLSVPKGANILFSVDASGNVTVYDPTENQIAVDPSATVYFPTDDIQGKAKAHMPDHYGPVYALALAQLRTPDGVDAALKTLSDIGDAHMVQKVSAAITNDEFGEAEKSLSACIVDTSKRFLNGQRVGCLPDPNAPDVLDVLSVLQNDPNAIFLPKYPSFQYKRVGRKLEVDGDYPRFKADASRGTSVGEIVWHKERLNASVTAFIPGVVELRDFEGKAPEYLGFSRVFPCYQIKTYSIINNGNLNVKVLPVTNLAPDAYFKLCQMGVIDSLEYLATNVYDLHLDRLPVLSRGKRQPVDAGKYAAALVDSKKLEAALKVFNALLNELYPKEDRIVTSYTSEQIALLAANGINEKGQYNPPTKKTAATDVLPAREFYASIDKLSSLPSLKAVLEKSEKICNWNGKSKEPKYTLGESLMAPFVDEFKRDTVSFADSVKIAWLQSRITDLKEAKQAMDRALNTQKFVMLMTGSWLMGYPRGETVVNLTDYTVTFDTDTKNVEI